MEHPLLRQYRGADPRRIPPGGGPKQQGLGSGVIVTPEGHILTSNHVIEGADEIMVSIGAEQKQYPAKKIGTDPATDLAVLKIDGEKFPAITFADLEKTQVGDLVLAIGNPFGVGQSVTMGIISAKGRGGMGMVDYENFIQTDASINPGNSGGALVDFEGRLVGINTAIVSRTGGSQGVGFAVPGDLARNVMQSILDKGRVIRGHLGVIVQPVTSDLAETFGLKSTDGALVTEVTPQSPAANTGVQRGDVITHVNGQKITDPRDLRLTVGGMEPGAKVEIKYLRDVQEKTAQVELAELPTEQGRFAQNDSSATGAVL
ncbi:MAG: trypsin-like peptidase domain-containing protein, partial [Chthoniobacterales bacterium]|nr:trypsin-like peptidase domain-containing protein [Chthoniobacterales bacterium]